MFLFYLNSKHQYHSRTIRNLFRSCPETKELQATNRFVELEKMNKKASVIVFAGMIRGEGLIYHWCKENNKNFIFVDHAYLNRGYNNNLNNEWMRVTYNEFTWNKFQSETSDRWIKNFSDKYSLSPWNLQDGKYILVLPPSEATKYLFPESVQWTEDAIQQVTKQVNLPLKIREKPDQPQIDAITNQVIGRLNFDHQTTIEQDLSGAKYVIAFNSAVTVQATLMGIPCICSSKSATYPVNSLFFKNPPEPNRQAWLDQLVHHQYTSVEIKTGEIWTMLRKYMG